MCTRRYCPDEAAWERAGSLPRRWHPLTGDWQPNYNVAPTDTVPIVRTVDGEREAVLARWGLVPALAKPDVMTEEVETLIWLPFAFGASTVRLAACPLSSHSRGHFPLHWHHQPPLHQQQHPSLLAVMTKCFEDIYGCPCKQ